MPAETEKEREMMAIALHHPEKLYKRNRGVLKMGKEKLHEFAMAVRKRRKARAKAKRSGT